MQFVYKYIEFAFNNGKYVNYHYITDYINSTYLQFNILKNLIKICKKELIYVNYKKILLLLHIIYNNKIESIKIYQINDYLLYCTIKNNH